MVAGVPPRGPAWRSRCGWPPLPSAQVCGLPACPPTPMVLVPLCPGSFRNFDVEESHQCSLDWLMLGPAAPPRQEAFRLCGSAIPPAFISARDHVWIFFHSDASSSGQAQGFRLSYIRGDANGRLGRGTTGHVGSQGPGSTLSWPTPCRVPPSGPVSWGTRTSQVAASSPSSSLTPLHGLGQSEWLTPHP